MVMERPLKLLLIAMLACIPLALIGAIAGSNVGLVALTVSGAMFFGYLLLND